MERRNGIDAIESAPSRNPVESRGKRIVARAPGAAASLCMRVVVTYISNRSARDPRAVVRQQRAAQAG